MGGDKSHYILERRLFSASSLHSKLRTLGIPVADVAMVDVPGMCLSVFLVKVVRYSYRRGLRSCLSLQGGKFEGQECEISNEYGSHAFLLCGTHLIQ